MVPGFPLLYLFSVWFRFGSFSVSSICYYRPGSVHVRFRFLRFLVDFGSVRFGLLEHPALICVYFAGARGLLFPASGFMSSGFQRAERAELGKPKLPEVVSACNLLWRNPYLLFSLNSKSNYIQLFQSVYWGRIGRFRFLRFGFAHGSSGSRFLRFIGYLIFYGSVPRFRFGSRNLLILGGLYKYLALQLIAHTNWYFTPSCIFWPLWPICLFTWRLLEGLGGEMVHDRTYPESHHSGDNRQFFQR